MKGNERFFIKDFICTSTEDDPEKGEVKNDFVSTWEFKTFNLEESKNSFKTIKDLLNKVCDLNCFDFVFKNWRNFSLECSGDDEDLERFYTDVLVDENNCEVTKEEIELWKNGKKRLWNCNISVYVGVKTVREIEFEDVKDFDK